MNSSFRVALRTSPEQSDALAALQTELVCAWKALAATVAAQRGWNRVALRHLGYKGRPCEEDFPPPGFARLARRCP